MPYNKELKKGGKGINQYKKFLFLNIQLLGKKIIRELKSTNEQQSIKR